MQKPIIFSRFYELKLYKLYVIKFLFANFVKV